MKKTILVVLLVLFVSVPCEAQEIEPDGLFSIEGTTWLCTMVFPFQIFYLSFYQGKIYQSSERNGPYNDWDYETFYVDLLAISLFYNIDRPDSPGVTHRMGIISPLGFGIMIFVDGNLYPFPHIRWIYFGLMLKVGPCWECPENYD